jgi:hypothetical protein
VDARTRVSQNRHTQNRLYGQVVARWLRPNFVPEESPVSLDLTSQSVERGEWGISLLIGRFAKETVGGIVPPGETAFGALSGASGGDGRL